jgi:pyridoxamine 5'-phosphate oxidase
MKKPASYIYSLRNDYETRSLNRATARQNPFEQLEIWLSEAIEGDIFEPNAMVLATATAGGKPSARIVLLRGFDESGFTFYTGYESRKARELAENPQASLLFYWAEMERQIRVEGRVSRAAEEVSDDYFASRPRESQIGAWVSPQSEPIESRAFLERKFAELAEQWKTHQIKRPPNWGGFVLQPEAFEFWQGRKGRLHDRLFYAKTGKDWEIKRLAP